MEEKKNEINKRKFETEDNNAANRRRAENVYTLWFYIRFVQLCATVNSNNNNNRNAERQIH